PAGSLHPEEPLKSGPTQVSVDEQRLLSGVRECEAEARGDAFLALVDEGARDEEDVVSPRCELAPDGGGQGLVRLALDRARSARTTSRRLRDLRQDRQARQLTELPRAGD